MAAQCLLVGGVHLVAVTTPNYSTASSSSSPSASSTRPRLVRLQAGSSPPSEAASSSNAPSSLDIAPAPPASATSLVSRTPQIMQPEGDPGVAQVNHYDVLNVPYGSSTTQIAKAFKDRYDEVTSQRNEENGEASSEQLRALQVSFEILSSEQERRVYDWVLQRYQTSSKDTYIWPYETDITQRYTNKDPPPVMRSFDEEGNRKVGLFFLGWLILSIVFSVTMKTWIPHEHYTIIDPL